MQVAFVYNHKDDFYYDDGKWLSVIEYGLQVFDFVTDINLVYEMLNYVSNNYGTTGDQGKYILIAALGALTFTVLPYLINMYTALSIHRLVKHNIVAKLYFEHNATLFVILSVCSGGVYSTLKLLSCHIFGLRILNCGLTAYDLRKLLPLKIYSSVILVCYFFYMFCILN